jgi:hypothetical protein
VTLLDAHHANASAEFQKTNTSKWLGENVRELLASPDVLNANRPGVEALSDEMVANFDVLTAIMKDRVFAQLNC